MGNCMRHNLVNSQGSTQNTTPIQSQQKPNKVINRDQLEHKTNKPCKKYKLLLLGGGESGKSTLLKQIRIMHGKEFTQSELCNIKTYIHLNVIEAMRTLAVYSSIFAATGRKTNVSKHNMDKRERVARMNDKQTFTLAHYKDFNALLSEKGIQETLKHRHEFQLIDTAEYLFSHMNDYANPNYVPKFEDILHCRQRTSGIISLNIRTSSDTEFEIYDLGGQKNERKKWIQVFDQASAIIFVVALSGYNQTLWENNRTNRMLEAICLFNTVDNLSLKSLKNIHMHTIMFLNKEDIFNKKINSKCECNKLSNYFKDYTGDNWNKHEVIEFFKTKFIRQRSKYYNSHSSKIYFHITNATSTKCITNVFNNCTKIIMETYTKQKILKSDFV